MLTILGERALGLGMRLVCLNWHTVGKVSLRGRQPIHANDHVCLVDFGAIVPVRQTVPSPNNRACTLLKTLSIRRKNGKICSDVACL